MRVEDALGKSLSSKEPSAKAEGSSDSGGGYSYRGELRGELKSILGVDDSKADRLMRLFCAIAREEMDGGLEDESSEGPSSAPAKSVALILGSKPKE